MAHRTPQDPLDGLREGRGGKGKEGRGNEGRERREGKGEEGREGKGRGREGREGKNPQTKSVATALYAITLVVISSFCSRMVDEVLSAR